MWLLTVLKYVLVRTPLIRNGFCNYLSRASLISAWMGKFIVVSFRWRYFFLWKFRAVWVETERKKIEFWYIDLPSNLEIFLNIFIGLFEFNIWFILWKYFHLININSSISQVMCAYRHLCGRSIPRPNGWSCTAPWTSLWPGGPRTSDLRPSLNILIWWGPIPDEMGPSPDQARPPLNKTLLTRQSPPLTRCGPGLAPLRLDEDPRLSWGGPIFDHVGPAYDQVGPLWPGGAPIWPDKASSEPVVDLVHFSRGAAGLLTGGVQGGCRTKLRWAGSPPTPAHLS